MEESKIKGKNRENNKQKRKSEKHSGETKVIKKAKPSALGKIYDRNTDRKNRWLCNKCKNK